MSVLTSHNPANGEIVWQGATASNEEVNRAISMAKSSFSFWSSLPLEKRIQHLYDFKEHLKNAKTSLAEKISLETGKPLWESLTEVQAMIGKVDLSVESFHQRCATLQRDVPGALLYTRHKPHGIVAVFGPYNFPGHLPNGHIVPALLAGNTVVFKPSEYTPAVAEATVKLWETSGLPNGVLNLVQGGPETGTYLASHPDLAGLFFTGSWTTGKRLSEQYGAHPEKILALEMGGNNPLVISQIEDLNAAAYYCILSAYLTTGQRCSCARRLILIRNSPQLLPKLQQMIENLKIGAYTDRPEPFMGPVVSFAAAKKIADAQRELIRLGGKPLIELKLLKDGTGFVSPGLIDVTHMTKRFDEEIFGPLLQVVQVPNLEAAIDEANHTKYGLTAGIFTDDKREYELFSQKVKAGIINWNTALTGASSAAPFGGIGASGNHRPSAYYAADYCSYPVASMEASKLILPSPPSQMPGIRL